MEENTTQTTDLQSQGAADASSTSNSPTDNTDDKSFADGFWGDEASDKQSESEESKIDESDTKSESSDEGEEQKEPEFPKAEARKAELNEDIRSLVSHKHELEREVSQLEGIKSLRSEIEANRVTPEQLEALGLDPQDAAIQAILHNQQVDAQEAELREIQADIADLQYNLAIDRIELLKDFPVFDEKSPEYDPDFTGWAMQLYATAANLQLDENGAPVSASLKLYDFMSQLANARAAAAKKGSDSAAKAKQKQAANVMVPGGNAPAPTDADDENKFVNNFFN